MKNHLILLLLAEISLMMRPVCAEIVQQAYLKASNSEGVTALNPIGDRFGDMSVAISGDTVVVGAPYESSNAIGANGDQSDNSALYSGAAYVFVRSGTNWTQQAYLKASNSDYRDFFGASVAVSGDTLVVGAPNESSGATGVNGDQTDNSVESAGAAYVFVRTGTNWIQQAYFKASNPDSWDKFGGEGNVSISGDTIVVGAYNESSNASGVNGDQADNSAFRSGAAYVFVRSGTNWTQQAYLKASNPDGGKTVNDNGDLFGWSLSLSGDTLVVGAVNESSNATGVNGDQTENSAPGSGAAYVFVRTGTNWTQQAYLKASNPDPSDHFGRVSVSSDTIVVGALGESSKATGVNGDQSDNSALYSGAAYVFVRSGTNWTQEAYLKASNPDGAIAGISNGDQFGGALSLSGDTLIVGSRFEYSNATGIDGDQNDNSVQNAGAAYLFVRSGTDWAQQAYLKASNTGANDYFGSSLWVSGETVVIGAPVESSNAAGVNGNQADNSALGSGAAYIFTGLGNVFPRLTLRLSGSTGLIAWPSSATGFVLQSATTLANGGDWEDSAATPSEVDGYNVVTVGSTEFARFFRLRKP